MLLTAPFHCNILSLSHNRPMLTPEVKRGYCLTVQWQVQVGSQCYTYVHVQCCGKVLSQPSFLYILLGR